MKGLSMTLEIVIIAIVLLVTALVLLTVFGGQMSNVLATLGFFQGNTVQVSQCQSLCSNWCFANRPETVGPAWGTFTFEYQGKTINCANDVMNKLPASSTPNTNCKCTS